MDRAFVRKHLAAIAVALFVVAYAVLNYYKPACMYNRDGSLRQFGVGRARKTVIPVWLAAVLLATCIYLGLMYYLAAPNL